MSAAAWRASLRIARRDALRHKGRSILVVAMLMLPVLGMTAGDVLVRTQQLTGDERASRAMGQADAIALGIDTEPIEQGLDGRSWMSGPGPDGTRSGGRIGPDAVGAGDSDIASALPAGAHALFDRRGGALVHTSSGLLHADVRELSYEDPLATGLIRQREGRSPQTTGEVVVSARLLRDAGLKVGGTLQLETEGASLQRRSYLVVGTVVDPGKAKDGFVLALPGAILDASDGGHWLVAMPASVPMTSLVPALNQAGVLVQARQYVLHPLPTPASREDLANRYGTIVVGVGLAVLQIILLAATAFAVGARRQRHDLALVAVSGGDRRQVRAMVLASGAVLGLAGAVLGVAVGIPLAAVTEPIVLARLSASLPGPFDVRPLELLVIVALGVITGLVAAALPARNASRQSVTAALSGRRGITRAPRWITIAGLAMVGLGALAAWRAALTSSYTGILTGAVLAELGFVACAPALIGAAGLGARWCALPIRLALRDASRNRTRSSPAVAAIMAALAGSVALSTYLVSTDARDRQNYTPRLHAGQVEVRGNQASPAGGPEITAETLAPVASALSARSVTIFRPTTAQLARAATTGCRGGGSYPGTCFAFDRGVAIGDAAALRAVLGRDDDNATRALANGKVVVLHPEFVDHGQVRLGTYQDEMAGYRTLVAPAFEVAADIPSSLPTAFMSPETAARLGIPDSGAPVAIFDTGRAPSSKHEQQARAALAGLNVGGWLYAERGYTRHVDPQVMALLAMSVVVTFGATAVATALAAAEGQSDLAIFSAVGAGPHVGRGLAMAQAATVAGLGSVLGVVAGLVPALAVLSARSGYPLVLPWTTIGVGVVVVPAIAALCAGLLRSSRLPMPRRSA